VIQITFADKNKYVTLKVYFSVHVPI